MSFDGKYLDWNSKRIKGIVDFYGHKFFYYKKVADLGCGYADISGVLHRLGSDITAVDARQEHLKMAVKKYPGIKVLKADLDRGWPFAGKKFDMILDLDIICHLDKFEQHLRDVCAHTTHLILETAVCDSDDPNKVINLPENKNIYDLSANGISCRPSAAAIERVLQECGMNFKRVDSSKFNSGSYVYDWESKNNEECSINKRRIWFAVKNSSPMQFAVPSNQETPILPPQPPPIALLNFPDIPYISPASGSKKFVIVIPSYNNQRWCVQNITSAMNQSYDNFRVIFTDDHSSDDTFTKVSNAVNSSGKAGKVTLIRNPHRMGALANLYNMIHSCADDEIILTLDGDDWFPHERVLSRLNEIYSSPEDIWMTYGQYQNHPDHNIGIAQPYPLNVIDGNSFRQFEWRASHLRTFYAWLFKSIKKEDLYHNGNFMSMTWDLAMMFPMLEMSGRHSKFISDILYIYNMENPINDHKVNVRLQQDLDRYVRTKPSYSRRNRPAPPKNNIGLLLIATGKYHKFIQGLISSADKHFLNNVGQVTYYVFSDTAVPLHSKRSVVNIPIAHRPFPFASMDRFKHFINNADKLAREDYLYYVDVDSLFVDNISSEIFGNLVGVRHCGYFNTVGPYESNPKSSLYIDNSYPKKYRYYFGGGFSGGKKDQYLELSRWCNEMIEKDIANGVMPIWHDETAINRYFLDNEPNIILSPSYHYPQSNLEYYKRIWDPNVFNPKILLLDKNHQEIRK